MVINWLIHYADDVLVTFILRSLVFLCMQVLFFPPRLKCHFMSFSAGLCFNGLAGPVWSEQWGQRGVLRVVSPLICIAGKAFSES